MFEPKIDSFHAMSHPYRNPPPDGQNQALLHWPPVIFSRLHQVLM